MLYDEIRWYLSDMGACVGHSGGGHLNKPSKHGDGGDVPSQGATISYLIHKQCMVFIREDAGLVPYDHAVHEKTWPGLSYLRARQYYVPPARHHPPSSSTRVGLIEKESKSGIRVGPY